MSESKRSLTAVVVSGGKQYHVAPGDQILVDRLEAKPGSSIKLGKVLLLHDGDEVKVGKPGVAGVDVEAKVLSHKRGPRIEILRYKSKKHVRVHRGARADLTALQILTVGGKGLATEETKTAKVTKGKAKAKVEAVAEEEVEVVAEVESDETSEPKIEAKAKAPAKAATKKTEKSK
jgi:large subunit ribosomal protein L21